MNRLSASAVIVAVLAFGIRLIVPSDLAEAPATQPVLANSTPQPDQNVDADPNLSKNSAGTESSGFGNGTRTEDGNRDLDFKSWPVGQTMPFNSRWNRSYSDLDVKLVKIEKVEIDKISLIFEASVGPKQYFGKFDYRNSPENPRFLFVYNDSYIHIGSTKSLYAEGMHLIDGNGKKYKALNGIEGVKVEPYNSNAFRAILPWSSTTKFTISFPVPDGNLTSLKFVSPYLSGHQDEWYVDIL